MDDIPEIVYIVDIETYELLYLNDPGKRAFGVGDVRGATCYRVLQNADRPCPFCTNDKLSCDRNYTWDGVNPVTNTHYLFKDRLVDWEGRPARLEIAFDMESSDKNEEGLRFALDAESMVLECTRDLYSATDIDEATSALLSKVGAYVGADRACVFLRDDERLRNSYEWCVSGVASRMALLEEVDFDIADRWQRRFQQDGFIVYEDVDDLRDIAPEEHAFLSRQNVKTLAVAPLRKDGRAAGFINLDNPPMDRIRNLGSLLQTLAYFYMMTVQRLRNEQRLVQLSYHDELTGLLNRNCYINDVDRLQGGDGSLGVVYVDVNNLKVVNDRYGHGSGDDMLRACARAMARSFADARTYRVGGDEFVSIVTDVERERFSCMVASFERTLEALAPDMQIASVGSRWEAHAADVAGLLATADAEMYERKRAFHVNQALGGMHPEAPDVTKSSPRPLRMEDGGTLLSEYNMLMSALRVSVSKHLMTEKFEVVWANDFYYEMSGYTRDEYERVFNNNVGDYFARCPDEFRALGETVRKALAAGESGFECLASMPVKDGGFLWVRVVGMFTNEQVDGIPVLYVTFVSVNDVIQAERERSVAFDNIPGFVARYRVGEDGLKLLYGNKHFVEYFGSIENPSASEVLQENLAFNDAVIGEHFSLMRSGEPLSFDVDGLDARGRKSLFKVFAECIGWEKGDPVYLVLYLDATERVS